MDLIYFKEKCYKGSRARRRKEKCLPGNCLILNFLLNNPQVKNKDKIYPQLKLRQSKSVMLQTTTCYHVVEVTNHVIYLLIQYSQIARPKNS